MIIRSVFVIVLWFVLSLLQVSQPWAGQAVVQPDNHAEAPITAHPCETHPSSRTMRAAETCAHHTHACLPELLCAAPAECGACALLGAETRLRHLPLHIRYGDLPALPDRTHSIDPLFEPPRAAV